MPKKNYSEQFRRDAVELYRCAEGATIRPIAQDLGVRADTLSGWIRGAVLARRPTPGGAPVLVEADGPGEIARLRRRGAELEAEQRKLVTEREILRQAAPARAARAKADQQLARWIKTVHEADNTIGAPGRPSNSTTVLPPISGSTTNGSPG